MIKRRLFSSKLGPTFYSSIFSLKLMLMASFGHVCEFANINIKIRAIGFNNTQHTHAFTAAANKQVNAVGGKIQAVPL